MADPDENQRVGYIENGIVIDHLPVGTVWRVAELLGVTHEHSGTVSLGDGHSSRKIGAKGFIKIEGRELNPYELNLVALVAPNATVTYVRHGQVAQKTPAKIPDRLEGVVLCPNTNCISNDPRERGLKSLIFYDSKEGEFSCHYCHHEFTRADAKILASQADP